MPWNKKDYPRDWDSIRAAVMDRAGQCCEGSPLTPECRAVNHQPHPVTGSRVVLTTAHLCRCEPKCGELSHLKMLCQKCHLTLDSDLHVQHAAAHSRLAKEALGQLPLFG